MRQTDRGSKRDNGKKKGNREVGRGGNERTRERLRLKAFQGKSLIRSFPLGGQGKAE